MLPVWPITKSQLPTSLCRVALRLCTCDGPCCVFDTATCALWNGRTCRHAFDVHCLPSCLKNALMRMWMLAVEFTIRLVVFWRLLLVLFTR